MPSGARRTDEKSIIGFAYDYDVTAGGTRFGDPDGDSLSYEVTVSTPTPRVFNFTEEDKQALEAFLNTLTDTEFLNDPRFSDPFQQ